MGKKYVMFVDERGFLSTDINKNFSIMGVVFEYNYCIDLEDKECELKAKWNQYKEKLLSNRNINISVDDIMIKEKSFKGIEETQRKEFINDLPLLLRNLKFTIISSTIKQSANIEDSYYIATKNLIKSFYLFIMKKKGESGGLVIETRQDNSSYMIQQDFFNIYNERSTSLSMLENIQDKINTFIICEKSSKTYGLGIEISNVLNIVFRILNGVKEFDSQLISSVEYGNRDKIFNTIKHKIYKDTPIQISKNPVQKISYNSIEIFNKELETLKEQLKFKDIRINENENKINQLNNEIQLLNQQLEEALLNRKSNNIIFRILSDIDFKMKGIEKKARVAKS